MMRAFKGIPLKKGPNKAMGQGMEEMALAIKEKKEKDKKMEDLERFKRAQGGICGSYKEALAEIKSGRKTSHWMWYIFPQLKELGKSSNAIYYGIRDLEEAKEYLQDETLRGRLVEISEALLKLECNDAREIFGGIDKKKLKSCMTLFLLAEPENEVFRGVLEKFFCGKIDERTKKIVSGK